MSGRGAPDGAPGKHQLPRLSRTVLALLVALATLTTGLLLARIFLFHLFSVSSASMQPGLLTGDYVMAWTGLYRWGVLDPAAGDVVLYRLPRDESVIYADRIIGMPGDRVQMRASRLVVNGQVIARRPAGEVQGLETLDGRDDPQRMTPVEEETLEGGASYLVLDQDPAGLLDTTPEVRVPDGHYFVLGDNRDNSVDSRMAPESGGVGLVPRANIIGRAALIYFSIGSRGLRPERLGTWIR